MTADANTSMGSLRILAVGSDAGLANELEAAWQAADTTRAFVQYAADYYEAARLSRSRMPDALCVELTGDTAELRDFITSMRALDPDLPLLGVRPDASDAHGTSDSAILVQAIRAGFLDVIPRPISSTDIRRVMSQVTSAVQQRRNNGRVLVFHSTKGGVGKSTLSTNVACGLAMRHPDRVLLIDASLQLGVCSVALDMPSTSTLADAARERDRLDETLLRELSALHESGVRLLASPRDPIDAADVDEEALARVIAMGRRAFDYVVVDTLPTVDGTMLTVLDLADEIFLINQGTVPDVIGAAHLLETLDQLEIAKDRRRVVLNRNLPSFTGALTANEVEERLGCPVDYEIPHDRKVLTSLNLGEPRILKATQRFGWGRAMRQLIDDIEYSAEADSPVDEEEVGRNPLQIARDVFKGANA